MIGTFAALNELVMHFRSRLLLLGVALSLARPHVFAGPASTNESGFGFTGPEIFPVDPLIGQLHAADLDGDGLNDLIVVNNLRSKITLLYNQTGHTNAPPRSGVKREINELPPEARFRIQSIASEKRIASLVVDDLNGDGRPDIAYYGDPKELIVLYNGGTKGWSAPKRWLLDDAQLTGNALTSGDLNGDGLTDLLLLSETFIYFFPQRPDHTLGEPQKIPIASPVKLAQVLDIDGDGKNDLFLVDWESPTPFRFRLQVSDGQLAPEIYFTVPPIRALWAEDLSGDKEAEVVTIAQNSGRAAIGHFIRTPAAPLVGSFRQGQFSVLPLNRTEKARRGLIWADINGDGVPELLVAEPESGQLSVFFQKPDGTLGPARTFPSLTGVSDLAVADWNGDGKREVFLLSPDERQVGVTRLDANDRLPFPTLIPTEGRPLAMAVGALRPGAKPTLVVIVDNNGKRSLLTRTADGKTKSQRLGENFKSNPSGLVIHDVDQDGLPDLVILIPYEKVKILRQVAGKDFDELDVALPGGSLEQPWMSTADVDGDGKEELLLAQKNFLRAVVLKPVNDSALSPQKRSASAWVFSVKEQINGAASNSRLVGAVAMPEGKNGAASLALLDAERKALTLCQRDAAGVWQVVRNVPLPVSEFSRLDAIAIGGTQPNALAFVGANVAAYMPLSGDVWEYIEMDSYETPVKDGRLHDVVAGDLDNDGRKDLVFLETARNYVDIVRFDKDRKLVPGNRWQVFEERTFRSRRSDLPEPREAIVADVTGGGKSDLIIIVHDRILVYPQD